MEDCQVLQSYLSPAQAPGLGLPQVVLQTVPGILTHPIKSTCVLLPATHLKVQLPFLLPLQASTTALQIAWVGTEAVRGAGVEACYLVVPCSSPSPAGPLPAALPQGREGGAPHH